MNTHRACKYFLAFQMILESFQPVLSQNIYQATAFIFIRMFFCFYFYFLSLTSVNFIFLYTLSHIFKCSFFSNNFFFHCIIIASNCDKHFNGADLNCSFLYFKQRCLQYLSNRECKFKVQFFMNYVLLIVDKNRLQVSIIFIFSIFYLQPKLTYIILLNFLFDLINCFFRLRLYAHLKTILFFIVFFENLFCYFFLYKVFFQLMLIWNVHLQYLVFEFENSLIICFISFYLIIC